MWDPFWGPFKWSRSHLGALLGPTLRLRLHSAWPNSPFFCWVFIRPGRINVRRLYWSCLCWQSPPGEASWSHFGAIVAPFLLGRINAGRMIISRRQNGKNLVTKTWKILHSNVSRLRLLKSGAPLFRHPNRYKDNTKHWSYHKFIFKMSRSSLSLYLNTFKKAGSAV